MVDTLHAASRGDAQRDAETMLDAEVPQLDAALAEEPAAAQTKNVSPSALDRVTANRANAARSTGPRTPAGLARASGNALSHGLSARSVVVRGESAEQWETFRDATLADLDARGAVEHALATRVAELLWRLQRAGAVEAAVANFALDGAEEGAVREALDAEENREIEVGALDAQALKRPEGYEQPVNLGDARTLADLDGCVARAAAIVESVDALSTKEMGDSVPREGAEGLLRFMADVAGADLVFVRPPRAGLPPGPTTPAAPPRPPADAMRLDAYNVGAMIVTAQQIAGRAGSRR